MKILLVDDEYFSVQKIMKEMDELLLPRDQKIPMGYKGKSIVLCGNPELKAVMNERLKDDSIIVLTFDDAREQGIDTTEAIIHSLPPMKIVKPFFEEKRKGHVRPYKFHR
jgi:hypothetical protein